MDAADVLAALTAAVAVPEAEILALGDGAAGALAGLVASGWAERAGAADAPLLALTPLAAQALGIIPDAKGERWIDAAGVVPPEPRARPEWLGKGVKVEYEADRLGPPGMGGAEDHRGGVLDATSRRAADPECDRAEREPWEYAAAREAAARSGKADPALIVLRGTRPAWDHLATLRPDGGRYTCAGCGSVLDGDFRRVRDELAPGEECLGCSGSGRPQPHAHLQMVARSMVAWLAARARRKQLGKANVQYLSLAGGTGRAKPKAAQPAKPKAQPKRQGAA